MGAELTIRVSLLAQNATGNLVEWEHGIAGMDSPVSELESILGRHRLTSL
jgi:hypothetical protein